MPRDPYRYFRIEAREILEQLGQGTLDLEKGVAAPEQVARLLRLAHTLKGAARVVGQQLIADQAHAIEDALVTARDSAAPIARDRFDVILRLLDSIAQQVATLTPDVPAGSAGQAAPEELFRAFRPDIHEMDALLHGVSEAYGHLASLRARLTPLERGRHLAELVADQLVPGGAREPLPASDGGAQAKARSMAEELRSMLDALDHEAAFGVAQIDRELREVRSAAERLQLVPASALFTLLERAARDAAQTVGREVVFEAVGGDIRIDSRVLGIVQSALVQVIRNAVAHGIEPPADRKAAGKRSEGRVVLSVARRGTKVSFACTDDGGGVDLAAVRRIAQRQGLLSAAVEKLGPEELLRLLLKGGISTSGAVTEVSGRGVGLDVVREAAERLDGDVAVRTAAGKGTTIELTVSISLASFQGLLVEAAGATMVLPLDAVGETMRVSPEAVVQTSNGRSILHAGSNIPFVPLARAIGTSPHQGDSDGGPWTAVVVKGPSTAACLIVDRILGTDTVVLRPLPALAPAADGISGAALDVDGTPRLVLEPDGIVASAQRVSLEGNIGQKTLPSILVIDDSLTTRMLEQSILESAGYQVDLASSGEEGLDRARAGRYALFLVDVEMPGMDGFTFIERAGNDPALRDIPSILVTSRSSLDDRRRGQEAGARAFIVKNEFDQGVLLDCIRRLVG